MDYASKVDAAPPGWRHFTLGDLDRLPPAVRAHGLAEVPEAELQLLATHEPDAVERLRRAFFWTFVYHLEPLRWQALAEVEPIHPDLLAALPSRVERALDVGAGGGRLTQHLVGRSRRVVAVDPAAPLLRMLARRMPGVTAVAGWAEALPMRDGVVDLTAACGALGPDTAVLDELARVTAPGGTIALISPERPEWFEANGWTRLAASRVDPPPHDSWIDDFFGPPDPPHELVMLVKEG